MMGKPFLKEHLTSENKDKVSKVVHRVAENCWNMIQLIPPMTLGLQPSCNEDCFERKLLRGQSQEIEFEDLLRQPNMKLQLMRPTLFFTPHGTYKQKGAVAIVEEFEGGG